MRPAPGSASHWLAVGIFVFGAMILIFSSILMPVIFALAAVAVIVLAGEKEQQANFTKVAFSAVGFLPLIILNLYVIGPIPIIQATSSYFIVSLAVTSPRSIGSVIFIVQAIQSLGRSQLAS
jgi:hypothetical protein